MTQAFGTAPWRGEHHGMVPRCSPRALPGYREAGIYVVEWNR
jgi:hypothetical protein